MTKREYKRAAKAACEANGLKIPMIHMTLLEAGGDQYGALYVMFSDKRTGKEYQCRRDRQDWTWSACECEQTTTPETPAENETKGEKTTMTKKEMNATVEALEQVEAEAEAPALTIERVAEALAEIQSMEPSGDSVTYYLHVTASGEIVSDRQTADQTLTFSVPLERYGITGQEENPQKIYDTETMSNPIFAEIVQNLTEQANLWLEQENHSEKSEPERAMYSTIQEALSIFDELSKDGVHTIKEDVSGEIMTGTPADLVQRIIEQDKRTAGNINGNINHSFSTVEGAAIIETAYAISDGEAITTDDGRHIWNPRRREAGDQ